VDRAVVVAASSLSLAQWATSLFDLDFR